MNQNAYQGEIEKGLWFLSPQIANSYLHASVKNIDKQPSLISGRDIEAGFIRDIIGPDGNIIDIQQDEVPQGSVGIVRCIGSMSKYGGWFNWGTDELIKMMKDFDKDPNIIGQVWHDDSGGGTVSSVPPYLDFLKHKTKPVVSLLDTCGSASYYKNCGTDFMMAENNTSAMFGSIGVMISFYDYKKMLKDMGIVEHIIEADQSNNKNQAFKLAMEGKYDLIKSEYLNPLALGFQNDVRAARPKLKEAEGVLTGKMFYADEALRLGMIDGIGNMEAAIDQVKFLASARSFISTNY